jgi:transposase-like protein
MAAKKQSAGFDLLLDGLKANKNATYAELRAKAVENGVSVFPIMYGRAKKLLGLTGKSGAKKPGPKPAAAKTARSSQRGGRAGSKSETVRVLLRQGMGVADIAAKVGCTPALVYNVKSKMGRARSVRTSAARSSGLGDLAGLLDAVKKNEVERSRLRGVLSKIQDLLASVL